MMLKKNEYPDFVNMDEKNEFICMPNIVNTLEKEICDKQKEIIELKDRKKEAISTAKLICVNCKSGFAFKDAIFIQTHWYVPPRGCTEGDYWQFGEINILCPNCNVRIRVLNENSLIGNQITAIHFKKKEDLYD